MNIRIYRESFPSPNRDGKISAEALAQHINLLVNELQSLMIIEGDGINYHLCVEKDFNIYQFRWICSDGTSSQPFYEVSIDLNKEADAYIAKLSSPSNESESTMKITIRQKDFSHLSINGTISSDLIAKHYGLRRYDILSLLSITTDINSEYFLCLEVSAEGKTFFQWRDTTFIQHSEPFYSVSNDLTTVAEAYVLGIQMNTVSTERKLPSPSELHTFYLVWKRDNGGKKLPRHRHPVEHSAMKEAERLSLKYPESKIYVMEAIAKFINGERIDYPIPNTKPLAIAETQTMIPSGLSNKYKCIYSPGSEVELNNKYGVGKWHCDDILDSGDAPECVLEFLKVARAPAYGVGLIQPPLYANQKLEDSDTIVSCRVVMASQFGDVGIRYTDDNEPMYDRRVSLAELTDFRTTWE